MFGLFDSKSEKLTKKIHKIKLCKSLVTNFNESIIFYKTLLVNSPNQKLINKSLKLFEEINDEGNENCCNRQVPQLSHI